MNPLIQGHSGTARETSRNALRTIQGRKDDDSQNDPHPEAGIFNNQTTQNSESEDDHDMATRATEQIGDERNSGCSVTVQFFGLVRIFLDHITC